MRGRYFSFWNIAAEFIFSLHIETEMILKITRVQLLNFFNTTVL